MTPLDWMFFKRMDILGKGPEGNQELYLRRWILARTPWFQILLHKICRPDADRDLHDHPWSFRSLILKGGYVEEIIDPDIFDHYHERNKYERVNKRAAFVGHDTTSFHRIDRLLDGPAWTLVFTTGKRKSWGFLVNGKAVNHREYLASKGLAVDEKIADDW